MRLGVSKDVAVWFNDLDDGGLSFLDTPLYAQDQKLHSPVEMLRGDCHMSGANNIEELSYKAERGIGQGESASSLMWTALYDILLDWIDPRNRHQEKELEEYSDADANAAIPYAYADDLATVAAGPRADYLHQKQADWLSAFCAFSGLVMHPDKIRSTIVGPIPHAHPIVLTTHDHQWHTIECPVDVSMTTYKYLGVHLDLRCRTTEAFDKTRQDAQERLAHLLIQPGSPQAKIDYPLQDHANHPLHRPGLQLDAGAVPQAGRTVHGHL